MEPVVGTASATIAISVLPADPPHTYLGIAYAMFPAVRILADASPLPALPLAMVSAHVLECALKAYLSRSGDDRRLRKSDVRHNLEALWSLARTDGLNIQSQPPQWVTGLSQLHNSPYYLRYSTGVHGIVSPAPEPMATELAALIAQVQSQLQP